MDGVEYLWKTNMTTTVRCAGTEDRNVGSLRAHREDPMKSLTISVADDLYQRAAQKAAAAETSLPQVVQDLLSEWTQENHCPSREAVGHENGAHFLNFLDELAAGSLKPGPSVGPLNREELYQRGVSGH